jgi:hypothetical protein
VLLEGDEAVEDRQPVVLFETRAGLDVHGGEASAPWVSSLSR